MKNSKLLRVQCMDCAEEILWPEDSLFVEDAIGERIITGAICASCMEKYTAQKIVRRLIKEIP